MSLSLWQKGAIFDGDGICSVCASGVGGRSWRRVRTIGRTSVGGAPARNMAMVSSHVGIFDGDPTLTLEMTFCY